MTTQVVKNHDFLAVEDLAVTNMLKNHKLAKSIQDVSMGTILTQLKYKSEWHNRDYIEVDRFFASSKLCSCCGFKKDDLLLKDRSWTCPSCLTAHDRDINAAINILNEGIKKQSGCGAQSD
jgi:putative transposase